MPCSPSRKHGPETGYQSGRRPPGGTHICSGTDTILFRVRGRRVQHRDFPGCPQSSRPHSSRCLLRYCQRSGYVCLRSSRWQPYAGATRPRGHGIRSKLCNGGCASPKICTLPYYWLATRCGTLTNVPARTIRVIKWIGVVPVVGVCTQCKREFAVPLALLKRVTDAQASLQHQFDAHKCEQLPAD